MKKIFIVAVVALIAHASNAQNLEYKNWWFFGNNAGMEFNTGIAVGTGGGQTFAYEGTSCISDDNGNLMFYTDGITVWDRNHNVMPNGTGLMGNSSSSQSAMICPIPNDPDKWYIFTIWPSNGLRYTVVDMTLNSGNGEVLTAQKNILVHAPPVTEKLTGTPHCDQGSFWVVTHEQGNSNFVSYEVTNAGIVGPVISAVGPAQGGAIGYMNITEDGSRIGLSNYNPSLGVADFDNSTGVVANWIDLNHGSNYSSGFSPDGNMFYHWSYTPQNDIFQVDLTLGTPALINASRVLIQNQPQWYSGFMIGEDASVYVGRYMQPFAHKMTTPNNYNAAGFVVDAVDLLGNNARLAMPNYIPKYPTDTNYFSWQTSNVSCDTVFFQLNDTNFIDSTLIKFGDSNTSTDINPWHLYASPGTYNVEWIIWYECKIDTLYDTITVLPVVPLDLGPDTTLCAPMYVLDAGSNWADILWNTGDTTQTLQVTVSGWYYATVEDSAGCIKNDSVYVDLNGLAFDLGPDTASCLASPILLDAGNFDTYSWSTGATTQTINALSSGMYTVTVMDINGCTSWDSLEITQIIIPDPTSVTVDITCFGDNDGSITMTANGGVSPFTYSHDSGNNFQLPDSFVNLTPGTYFLVLQDADGCLSHDTVTINEPPVVTVTVSSDTTICDGQSAIINANAAGGNGTPYTYHWNETSWIGAGPHSAIDSIACYTVYAEDPNGCVSTTEQTCVDVRPPITVTANANPDTICPGEQTILSANANGGLGVYTYTWTGGMTGDNVNVIPNTYPNNATYIVTVSDGCSPDVYDTVIVVYHNAVDISWTTSELQGCEPFTTTFESTTPNSSSCTWLFGDGTSSNDCGPVDHTYQNAGQYDVTLMITTNEGCTDTLTKPSHIIVHPNPVAWFGAEPQPTTVLNTNIHFFDMSEGVISQWAWSFYNNDRTTLLGGANEQNPWFLFPEDTGAFPVNLEVTTVNGCVHDTTIDIYIHGVYNIFVPNAFTPNGDGLNDKFFPQGIGINPTDNFEFLIFDRWGEVIFRSTNLEDGWDGTAPVKGGSDLVQEGVYVWKIRTQEAIGGGSKTKHEYVGHVTLIK